MSASPPDFTDQELDVVRAVLRERYGHPVEIELAESELQLDPETPGLSTVPTVYWEQENCNFVVCKTGKQRFYCQLFYDPDEEYGTGRMYYDDVMEAVAVMLKLQAEHALKRRWAFS